VPRPASVALHVTRTLGSAAALGIAYFLLAAVGLQWATVGGAASPVFPAAGVAFAGLVLGGIRLWPAVLLGRLAAAAVLGSDLPVWADVSIAAGNTLAAVLGVLALQRAGFDPSLHRLRDVLLFVASAVGHSVVAGLLGSGTLGLALGQDWPRFGTALLNWWAGNTSGTLVTAPLVLAWACGDPLSRTRAWWVHLLLSTVAGSLLAWVIFGPTETPLLRTFLVFPALVWAALACGVRGATTAILPVAALATWGTTMGYGPLLPPAAAAEPLRFTLLLQFISATALTSLVLAVVADERRGKEALRESEERLALALEAGNLGFWDWDVPSGRVSFGGRWAAMLGYDLADIEPHVRSWERLIHPDDAAGVQQLVAEHLQGRTPLYECEHRLLHKDGSWRWILDRGRVVSRDEQGRPLRALGTHADITARRRAEEALRDSEQRLRLAGEAAGVGFFAWDVERDAAVLDGTCAALFGLEPNVPIPSATLVALIHPADRAAVQASSQRAAESEDRYEVEFRVVRSDGTTIWLGGLGNAVRDRAQGLRLAGVNWDITERKLAEAERAELLRSERAARMEAERASRLKDEFLSTLSHELRTPLNAIVGWSQLLRRRMVSDNEDLRQGLTAIDRNARAQVQLVEDLLDMSRVISGKLRLDVQPVDLVEVLNAAVASVAPSAEAREIRLECDLSPSAGIVRGDPARLQQVMWNLLSNAIKFTPVGGTVRVTTTRTSEHIEIAVSDTGEGVPREFLPYVFDRFRQADGTTTRKHGGLGIGLAIVKNLVELHGGQVRAASAGAGQGSTFTVALPISLAYDAGVQSAAASAVRIEEFADDTTASLDLTGISVLLVDDADDTREPVASLLENVGARVSAADSAASALELLRRDRYDVLVSDIGMPDVDGYDFIRMVRALPHDKGSAIPALALTAYGRAEDRTRALLAGFQMHLSKPVQPTELMAAISSLAGRTAGGRGVS
jgi:PAS domain S-box-containing protein